MSKNTAQKTKKHKAAEDTVTTAPIESFRKNLSRNERILSVVAGGGFLTFGVANFFSIRGQLANVSGLFMLGRGVSGYCPVYSAMGIDSSPNGRLHHLGVTDPHPIQFRQSITTTRSPTEVFEFCRDQVQAAHCFPFVKHQRKVDEHTSTWFFSDGSGNVEVPVNVTITQETPDQIIAWTAFPESKLRVTGSLQFKPAPLNQGTEVLATVHVVPPAGLVGATLMRWLSPFNDRAIIEVLHKMKDILENSEVPIAKGHVVLGLLDQQWQNRLKSRVHTRTMRSFINPKMGTGIV